MTPVTTKRHFFKFYLTLTFLFLFILGISTVMFFLGFNEFSESHMAGLYFFFLLGAFGVFFAFYSVIKYAGNSPVVSANETNVTFNKENFLWSNLEDIQLTGKQPFKYMKVFPMEGMMFRFKDGTIKYVFDDVYSNLPELKHFIQTVIIEKKDSKMLMDQGRSKTILKTEGTEVFKDNQFTSGRGMMLWGLIILFLGMIVPYYEKISPARFIVVLLFATGWFFFHSYMMNYFLLTDDYFVVKNHNFPWKKNLYRADSIKEIVFETNGNQPNCLRIITKGFHNKIYLASTLRDKTWLELEKSLNKKGIPVRNECIHP